MNSPVLVLNQNYEPLNVCNARRALVMVLGGKAEVLELNGHDIRTPTEAYRCPSVIRLASLIRRPRPRLKLSRREVFARDRHLCQYCGKHTRDLTLDHVIPRWRGGAHTWDNLVSACRGCNHRKGGRSPEEARMRLLSSPGEPRVSPYYVFVQKLRNAPTDEWRQYLPEGVLREH